jgi:hypothetical protein
MFCTGLDILPEQWDAKAGFAVGKSKEIRDMARSMICRVKWSAKREKGIIGISLFIQSKMLVFIILVNPNRQDI